MTMIEAQTVGEELAYRQGYRNAWVEAREFIIKTNTLGYSPRDTELAMREYQLSVLVPWLLEPNPKIGDSSLPECTIPASPVTLG